MQSQRKGSYLWLGIVVVLIFVMFTSSVVGGVVGFSMARRWGGSAANSAAAGIPALTIEPVNNVDGGATQQTLSITEQSASVETVSSTLPAVVTVLAQLGFGGGSSGSGFFISQDGYVVT